MKELPLLERYVKAQGFMTRWPSDYGSRPPPIQSLIALAQAGEEYVTGVRSDGLKQNTAQTSRGSFRVVKVWHRSAGGTTGFTRVTVIPPLAELLPGTPASAGASTVMQPPLVVVDQGTTDSAEVVELDKDMMSQIGGEYRQTASPKGVTEQPGISWCHGCIPSDSGGQDHPAPWHVDRLEQEGEL